MVHMRAKSRHPARHLQAKTTGEDGLARGPQDTGAGGTLHAVAAVERLRPEELARPAALRPLLTLLGCGDPGVERPALHLLTALVDSSAEAATLVRCTMQTNFVACTLYSQCVHQQRLTGVDEADIRCWKPDRLLPGDSMGSRTDL